MTREQREVYIQKELLKILEETGGYLLPDRAFFAQACLVIDPMPLRSEYDAAIRHLQSSLWITGVIDDFKQPKWKITDNGRATL